MKRKRQLEPEGTMSMRREHDRLSKARHRILESESEALLRQEQNRASMAKKRALEPESEVLLRKEHDRVPSGPSVYNPVGHMLLWTQFHKHG